GSRPTGESRRPGPRLSPLGRADADGRARAIPGPARASRGERRWRPTCRRSVRRRRRPPLPVRRPAHEAQPPDRRRRPRLRPHSRTSTPARAAVARPESLVPPPTRRQRRSWGRDRAAAPNDLVSKPGDARVIGLQAGVEISAVVESEIAGDESGRAMADGEPDRLAEVVRRPARDEPGHHPPGAQRAVEAKSRLRLVVQHPGVADDETAAAGPARSEREVDVAAVLREPTVVRDGETGLAQLLAAAAPVQAAPRVEDGPVPACPFDERNDRDTCTRGIRD